MPYDSGTQIGSGLANFGAGLGAHFARKRQEKDERNELLAWAESAQIKDSYPDIYRDIQAGRIKSVGVAANAVANAEKDTERRMADLQAKTMAMQDKDIKLASRATVDPTVRGMQQMDFRTGKWSPGARPNPQMVKRMERIGEANPDLYHEEKATVLKGELNPFSERLAAAKNATLAMAENRGKERAKAAGEQAWGEYESGAAPLSGPQLGKMGATFDQRMTYAGMNQPQAQKYAREGEEPEGAKPTWAQADRIREAKRRGLKEGTPEYFDFVHKEDEGGESGVPSNARVFSIYHGIRTAMDDPNTDQAILDLPPAVKDSLATSQTEALVKSGATAVKSIMGEVPDAQGATVQSEIFKLEEMLKQQTQQIDSLRTRMFR